VPTLLEPLAPVPPVVPVSDDDPSLTLAPEALEALGSLGSLGPPDVPAPDPLVCEPELEPVPVVEDELLPADPDAVAPVEPAPALDPAVEPESDDPAVLELDPAVPAVASPAVDEPGFELVDGVEADPALEVEVVAPVVLLEPTAVEPAVAPDAGCEAALGAPSVAASETPAAPAAPVEPSAGVNGVVAVDTTAALAVLLGSASPAPYKSLVLASLPGPAPSGRPPAPASVPGRPTSPAPPVAGPRSACLRAGRGVRVAAGASAFLAADCTGWTAAGAKPSAGTVTAITAALLAAAIPAAVAMCRRWTPIA
jgi:hypothetical protein